MTTAAEDSTISFTAYTEPVTDEELEQARQDTVNPLEALAETLAEPAERKPILRLKVPQRPSIRLLFDPNIKAEERKAWLKRAEERKGNRAARRRALTGSDAEVDPFAFACLVLAHTNRGVELDGTLVTMDGKPGGQPMSLRDEKLWSMMKQVDPEAAIRWLYGNDQHVEATAGEIIGASGIDDELEEVDPTEAAS